MSLLRARLERFALCAALVASCLALALPAHGQNAAAAERLFAEAQELMAQSKYEEACTKFEASMQFDPSAGTALNLARCNEQRGRSASAWAGYKQAATLFDTRGDAKRVLFANEQATALESSLSKLTVEAPAIEGLVVRHGGVDMHQSALGTPIPVDPGRHEVQAEAPGYETWTGGVTVGPNGDGQVLTIPALTLLPEGASEQPGPSPDPGPAPGPAPEPGPNALVVTGSALIGVGAVAAIIGGVLGGMVLGDASDAETDPALCGEDMLCTPEGLARIDSAEDKALAANILIGAGAAVAVGGAVMLIIGATSGDATDEVARQPTRARFVPAVGPEGAALHLVGTF